MVNRNIYINDYSCFNSKEKLNALIKGQGNFLCVDCWKGFPEFSKLSCDFTTWR